MQNLSSTSICTLHSTLFILVPWSKFATFCRKTSSTFHSVYISTFQIFHLNRGINTLHSTLFILVQQRQVCHVRTIPHSTFHSVYISTRSCLVDRYHVYASTFHSVYISTLSKWGIFLSISSSTFHSVYISTKTVNTNMVKPPSLHSTLFILVRYADGGKCP